MSQLMEFLNHGLANRVGDNGASALIIGIPAAIIAIVAWLVTGDLLKAIAAGVFGSALLIYVVASAAGGTHKPR